MPSGPSRRTASPSSSSRPPLSRTRTTLAAIPSPGAACRATGPENSSRARVALSGTSPAPTMATLRPGDDGGNTGLLQARQPRHARRPPHPRHARRRTPIGGELPSRRRYRRPAVQPGRDERREAGPHRLRGEGLAVQQRPVRCDVPRRRADPRDRGLRRGRQRLRARAESPHYRVPPTCRTGVSIPSRAA